VRRTAGLLMASALSACAASQVLVGRSRPPISPAQVQVYLQAPARYDEIAVLESSSRLSLAFSADAKTEAVIDRLKRAAAKLGANGLLLQSMDDQGAAAIGGSASGSTYSNHGSIDLGFSGITGSTRKFGSGLAIYVEAPPDHP
jgi:hypothetical protein